MGAVVEEGVEESLGLTGAVGMSVEEGAADAAVAVSAASPASTDLESSVLALVSAEAVGAAAAEAAGAADVEATVSAAAMPGTLMLIPYLLQRVWAKVRVSSKDCFSKRGGCVIIIAGLTLLISHTAVLLDL